LPAKDRDGLPEQAIAQAQLRERLIVGLGEQR